MTSSSALRTPHSAIQIVSLQRAGRVIPRGTDGLRAAVVELKPGASMGWHSTGSREELLIALGGRVQVEVRTASRRWRAGLIVGQCAFLPRATRHCVANRTGKRARYLYVTGSAA